MSIEEEAIAFAKKHKIEISRRLTDVALYPPSEPVVTIFMAGSPGAGKTEYSKNLVASMGEAVNASVVRLDSDELRSEIPVYTGHNASEVQGAVSILIREMYERTLKNYQTVIFDGTLANYDKAKENIERSLKRNRPVFIFYIYQRPEVAWQFTKARESVEGRNIPIDAFVRQFIAVREVVTRLREEFDDQLTIHLIQKNYLTNEVESSDVITKDGPGLDEYLPDRYTEKQIMELL